MKTDESRKAKQDGWRDTGLCVSCGDEVSGGISARTGRVYQTCDTCREKRAEEDTVEDKE